MNKLNRAKNDVYRSCFSDTEGDCLHASKNDYGVSFCSIDLIVQIDFYGCTPQDIINKRSVVYDEMNIIDEMNA